MSDAIEDQGNQERLFEPLIPSEVKDTNQAVSEANEQYQVVLCMSDYETDTREGPPGDKLMENQQKANPMKIVQHQKSEKSWKVASTSTYSK